MWKVAVILMLCSAIMAMPMVHSIAEEPKAVEEWFQKLNHADQKVTKLHFYFHDIAAGNNPTVVTVAQSNTTSKSPTFFGSVNIIDDPLTVGPELSSNLIGRAQGLYGACGLQEVSLIMAMNFVFTDGMYNGSTLTILGHNAAFHQYREMPIIGGSGIFRLARGVATAKTYSANFTTGDAIVEYNVIAIHY